MSRDTRMLPERAPLPKQARPRDAIGIARVRAARTYPPASICRRAILRGHWDGGSVVGAFLGDEAR